MSDRKKTPVENRLKISPTFYDVRVLRQKVLSFFDSNKYNMGNKNTNNDDQKRLLAAGCGPVWGI
jgi:hypothetical protein